MTDTHYIIARIQGQSAIVGHEARDICEEAARRMAIKYPEDEFFVIDETGELVYAPKVIKINLIYVAVVILCLVLLWNL